MPTSRESKIEDFAYDYLQQYYTLQQGAKNVLVSKSEKSKNEAEVDGLFAFKDRDNSLFLATLYFRNTQSIAKLLTNYKKKGLSRTRYITPFILLAVSMLFTRQSENLVYAWVLPFVVAIAGYFLHSILEKNFLKRKLKTLVNSLDKQHANEKWLGISISSLYFRNNSLASYFLKYCQRKGIGLVTVGKRSKVVRMLEPRTSVCRRGDYLSYYINEESIRKALANETILRVA
ncbi:hypothetical protein ACFSRY_11060 [Pontibacter locisalis]|uniref:Uncharacterized protein n=1 Tax=Pontibacter locisalis TaxID=1719035 RepID=A0ABW5IN14_9BACT